MVLIDASILMHPQVWQASGHLESFTDPLVDCKVCKLRFRADHVEGSRCPECGGELTEARQFNMMFKTFVGPVEEDAAVAYLRPETAQGIFVNFKNVQTTSRRKLPFGIAQVGKAFRNEITPGNFVFRTREFEQMEIEYFVMPGTDAEWHDHWVKERLSWYERYGMKRENLRLREHDKGELAHYAKATVDIDYHFPFGWSELEGIANRADYDLRQHQAVSGEDLTYFIEETRERLLPYVIEPSAGADRSALAFLIDAYDEEPDKDETRVVLRFHRDLAPIKAAFLPLSRKPDLIELTKRAQALVRSRLMTQFDDTQSIGRRYRRQDEIGTPYCVTIDFQSLEDQAATIRERDSMEQVRVPIEELPHWFDEAFARR
jgi:glycyl-tRNA synthetase